MTPAQIEAAARRKYNSTSSSFYSSAEIYDLIFQAETEIALETDAIEASTTISGGSVSGTRNYSYPSAVGKIKRVEYNGSPLEPITFDQDDQVTMFYAGTTETGTPQYYLDWNDTIYLRPVPDTSSDTIRLFHHSKPTLATAGSDTLLSPTLFHPGIVDFVAGWLALKDENTDVFDRYMDIWNNKHIPMFRAWARKKKTANRFKVVKDVDALPPHTLWIKP